MKVRLLREPKHSRILGALLFVAIAILVTGVAAGAVNAPWDSTGAASSSSGAPDPGVSKEIYGQDRAFVSDGKGGVAGWIDPRQLGANGDVKVFDDNGDQVGYWVDNLGFVDAATHDSPSYDPRSLRIERFGLDIVVHMEQMQADFEQCLESNPVAFCSKQLSSK